MKTDTQANQVYQEIRRRILISQIDSHSRLKEDLWAKKLEVSRMAVREALTRLLGEGLVTAGEKGGYYVSEMSAEDIRQIREIREILELAAVRLAVERATEQQLKELESLCNDFIELTKKGYILGACEADIKFHEMLVASSGNPRLLRSYHNSHIPLFHQRLGKTKSYMDDYDLTYKEHLSIVEALRKKDSVLGEKILLEHFRRGERAVLDL